jgi:hypothetical protein
MLNHNTELKEEIKELTRQIEQLQGLLESHECELSTEQLEAVEQRLTNINECGIEQKTKGHTTDYSSNNDNSLNLS